MERAWILHLLFCLPLNTLVSTQGNPLDDSDDTGLKFEDDLIYPETNTFLGELPDKRLSKFIRIGRGLSSFIRIGRDSPELNGFENGDDDLVDGIYDMDDKSAFESPIFEGPVKRRLSSFVRIGRGDPDISEPSIEEFQKRGAFIRMGKFPSSARLRHRGGRIKSIVRQPYYRRSGRIGQSSFIRIGKRDTTDALERMENEHMDEGMPEGGEYRRYLRIGKDIDGVPSPNDHVYEDKRLSNFVRIGRDPAVPSDKVYGQYMGLKDMQDKRFSKFVRIGKDGHEAVKRFSKFVRIGKGIDMDDDAMEKRMSKFVRIGKDLDNLESNIDKRLSNFVRIGKSQQEEEQDIPDKRRRFSSFVRIGKSQQEEEQDIPDKRRRFSSFVRIGKSQQDEEQNVPDKRRRFSSFVRIGKSQQDAVQDVPDKRRRFSSFVRIGKSQQDEEQNVPDKRRRFSSFVRIGKSQQDEEQDIPDKRRRFSSFVRIGKSQQDEEQDIPDKRRRFSSFVRIGKNYENPEAIGNVGEIIEGKTAATDNNGDDGNFLNIENETGTDTAAKSLDKRALSKFVRIGKSGNTNMDHDFEDVEKRRRLGSFVRIGRSTDTKQEETETKTDGKESK